MNRLLIVLLACTLAAGMVPRERRAVYSEEELKPGTESNRSKPEEICAYQTPCEWRIYLPVTKTIVNVIPNSYCVCSADTVCSYTEENTASTSYVYHCRPAPPEMDTTAGYES